MVGPTTPNETRPEPERLIQTYLDEHPGSTVVQVRNGVEAETGIRIERLQARIDRIGRRRQVTRTPGAYGRVAYSLDAPRRVVRAGGIEAQIMGVDGVATLDVRQQSNDGVLDPEWVPSCDASG